MNSHENAQKLVQSICNQMPVPERVNGICTTAQKSTPFVCGRGGGASARKGGKGSRFYLGVKQCENWQNLSEIGVSGSVEKIKWRGSEVEAGRHRNRPVTLSRINYL